MRVRMLAGIGVWVTAVAVVAAVAWVAIDTAGRQVATVTAAAPRVTVPPSTAATAITPPYQPPGRRADGARLTVERTVYGSYSASAGRIRSRCTGAEIDLDGGFARPNPGWAVSVLSGGPQQVWVVFQSRSSALQVLGSCRNGRPRFAEQVSAVGDRPPATGTFRPVPTAGPPPTGAPGSAPPDWHGQWLPQNPPPATYSPPPPTSPPPAPPTAPPPAPSTSPPTSPSTSPPTSSGAPTTQPIASPSTTAPQPTGPAPASSAPPSS